MHMVVKTSNNQGNLSAWEGDSFLLLLICCSEGFSGKKGKKIGRILYESCRMYVQYTLCKLEADYCFRRDNPKRK